MQIFKEISSIRAFVNKQKRLNHKVGLVPTMGALHNGHLSLVKQSIAENDISIASIFVNPIQFNNPSDLEKYPRTLDKDIEMLTRVGCSAAFCPDVKEMYQNNVGLGITFGDLEKVLEGAFRPGHFSGVGVVVSKLFNIVQPDVAYFGQKDYQQYLVIDRLVTDLSFPVKLICAEIVREENGLAMSSRNQRLTPAEKEMASLLYQAMTQSKNKLAAENLNDIKNHVFNSLSEKNIRLEYFELAERNTLKLLNQYNPAVPSILLIAAYVGEVRLIDNMFV